MTFSLALFFGTTAVAITSGVILLVLMIENRRFWKVHFARDTPSEDRCAKVNLIVPCKGLDDETATRLSSFFVQDHPNFRITFAVESATDPVVPLIRELQTLHSHVESSIVAAGRAAHRSQKVHNLLAAIDKLQKQVDIIAFADVDISVDSSWLRWLSIGVGREQVGARTGYRWMIPKDKKLSTLIGVNLNNAVASCLGKGNQNLIWGGSWAVHRRVFEQTGLGEAWQQVLSDDLVASKTLRNATFQNRKLQIQFEPRCLCRSEIAFSWQSLGEFMVRQLKITRLYSRFHWSIALLNVASSQGAFWGGVLAWSFVVLSGDRGALPTALMFGFLGVYVVGIARAAIRQNMARRAIASWRKFRRARRVDLFAWPVAGAYALMALLRSSVGNQITWSNIRYRISEGGRTMVLGRNIESSSWPVATMTDENGAARETIPMHRGAQMNSSSSMRECTPIKRSA